jgi:hypothetical protein
MYILIPVDYQVEMTEIEYYKYLINLKVYHEEEIFENCLAANHSSFEVDIRTINYILQKRREQRESIQGDKGTIRSILVQKQSLLNCITKKSNENKHLAKPFVENIIKDILHCSESNRFVNSSNTMDSVSNYINRILPILDMKVLEERKTVTVYGYSICSIIRSGEIIGDFISSKCNTNKMQMCN